RERRRRVYLARQGRVLGLPEQRRGRAVLPDRLGLVRPYRVAGGLQDNGSWMGPSETLFKTEAFDPGEDAHADGIVNDDWRPIFFGDGFTAQFDPTDPNLVYATSQGGSLARIRLDTNVLTLLSPSPRE